MHALPIALAGSAIALVLAASTASSQTAARQQGTLDMSASAAAAAHLAAAPLARVVLRDGPIVLDGRLDDAAWTRAEPTDRFTQNEPNDGQPATQRTEVRFLYDD